MNKMFLLLALIVFLISESSTNTNFQFNQQLYDVVMERADAGDFNKETVDYYQVIAFRVNRKDGILVNFTVTFKDDMRKAIMNHISTYQYFSNEYRRTNIAMTVNYCDVLKFDYFGCALMTNTYGNFTQCPWTKGTYAMYNYRAPSSKFPPLIPEGRYKLTQEFYHDKDFLFTLQMYGSIVYKMRNAKTKA